MTALHTPGLAAQLAERLADPAWGATPLRLVLYAWADLEGRIQADKWTPGLARLRATPAGLAPLAAATKAGLDVDAVGADMNALPPSDLGLDPARELLRRAAVLRVELRAEGGVLKVTGHLDPALRAGLRAHKAAVIALLGDDVPAMETRA